MVNRFDMAREMARLVDAGKSTDETVTEMLRMFPTATAGDCQRAMRIGLERLEMLEDERNAAAHNLADQLFGRSTKDKEAIDAAVRQVQMLPSAETLFPEPDKSKS